MDYCCLMSPFGVKVSKRLCRLNLQSLYLICRVRRVCFIGLVRTTHCLPALYAFVYRTDMFIHKHYFLNVKILTYINKTLARQTFYDSFLYNYFKRSTFAKQK